MRFVPLTPARLVADLAKWISELELARPRIGIDGPIEIGAAGLADAVAAELPALGRPAVRVSTSWWWRPASLRLELGRTDVDMLLGGWVDDAALRRELLDPLGPGGTGRYLRRLRDPVTDRSVREDRIPVERAGRAAAGRPVPAGGRAAAGCRRARPGFAATLARSLPPDRQWWLRGVRPVPAEDRRSMSAAVVVAYDHPAAPAISWAVHPG